MNRPNPLQDLPIGELFETLLPDFVLAFAFFSALTYAVMAKRFDQQRPAIAMSAALGFALSVGLVWWEQKMGLSIRDLGPLAVGLAIIILGAVMYQAFRQTGGSWAGAGIAIGASLLVSRLLGISWPLDAQVIQTVTTVALVMGIMAFLIHVRGHGSRAVRYLSTPAITRRDRASSRQSRVFSDLLGRRLDGMRRESQFLTDRPELAPYIVHQIERTLPAEGWLTERMAKLRKKVHQVRNGHVARLEETKAVFAKLPTSAKKQAAADLAARYRQLIGIDKRIERLDKATAANEKHIGRLTREAGKAAQRSDYRRLTGLLAEASKLQKHNARFFALIDRTEQKLTIIAEQVAKEAPKVDGGNSVV